jgi:DNA-binding CsgD family transcriptional regulator/tetratricopeptide (TPR) repeat protein
VGVAAIIGSVVDPLLLAHVSSASAATLDELAASGVLVSEGNLFRFRHEIIRVAVESEIPAHRRIPVHEAILRELEQSRDADVTRLAHHAAGTRDREAILRYSTEAGTRATELSSHREAAAHYELALSNASAGEPMVVAELSDRLALELGFLDRWDEAVDLRLRSLSLWRELGDRKHEGDCLRRLSTAMWRLARGKDAAEYAEASVVVLEPLGVTSELAWAYAELARQLMSQSAREEAISAARRAERLAEQLDLPDVLSDAMNTRACVELYLGLPWEATMREAIDIAVRRGADEQAGRAYANLSELLVYERRYDDAELVNVEGVNYLERRDVQVFLRCLLGHRLELLGATAQWDDALNLAESLLRQTSPINRHSPLTVAATIKARRGEPGASELLDEALAIGLGSTEAERIAIARLGRVELLLLTERDEDAERELQLLCELGDEIDEWARGALVEWIRRTGAPVPTPGGEIARPYRLAQDGDHSGAAQAWSELASPYEAAMALVYSGDEALMREGVLRLDAMNATAAARLARREMRRQGVQSVPAGMRSTTRANPAGLTNRELDVLRLLIAGHTNNEIAANLFISVKTTGHHVSAVLAKLGVSNRRAAAAEAHRLGIDVSEMAG